MAEDLDAEGRMGLREPRHDRFQFEAACLGKEQHETEAAAEGALRVYRDIGTFRRADNVHTYRCPFCDKWHLGHGLRRAVRGLRGRG